MGGRASEARYSFVKPLTDVPPFVSFLRLHRLPFLGLLNLMLVVTSYLFDIIVCVIFFMV